MSEIVELSTGHVFAKGSVKCIGPLNLQYVGITSFEVIGVGFRVEIPTGYEHRGDLDLHEWMARKRAKGEELRAEAIERLLR